MKKIFVLIAALVPVGIIGLVSCLGVSAQTTDTSSNATKQYNALWIPPILEGTTTATGTTYDLTLAKSSKQLLTGNATTTYGYNGNDFWGPTLVMKKGAAVTLNVTNKLSEDTTTHWHGLHLPAEMDGGPNQVIAPSATWSPHFTVINQASTYWYHPHTHVNISRR